MFNFKSPCPRHADLPQPRLPGLTAEPTIAPVAELATRQVQTPTRPQQTGGSQPVILRPVMDDPEDDPWNTPELHKGHDHLRPNGGGRRDATNGHNGYRAPSLPAMGHDSVMARYAPPAEAPGSTSAAWRGYYPDGNSSVAGGFADRPQDVAAAVPFGGDGSAGRTPGVSDAPAAAVAAAAARGSGGHTDSGPEETVAVTLMPEKEGIFLFQHHNYEVACRRRASKVIRRYSDFVWLLDCLQKRYPFRVLPLLPPKRVAVNGNHLSNDGAFIEKRRRGLARFLNALVRHPVLSQEQLVVMFLTVPTVRAPPFVSPPPSHPLRVSSPPTDR